MDILTIANTGLALLILGFIVSISRTVGHMEGKCNTRGSACDTRFVRVEQDVRMGTAKSVKEADEKAQEDLTAELRLNRIELDVKAVKAELIDKRKV